MTPAPRFLFDECVGKPHVDSLRSQLADPPEIVHITEFYCEGVKDIEWIPRLASEPGWVVITADRGTHSKRGDKLPAICREYRLTHVLLSKAVHHLTSHDKMTTIRRVWVEIEALSRETPGGRYRLRFKPNKENPDSRLVLEKVEPTDRRKKRPRKKGTKK